MLEKERKKQTLMDPLKSGCEGVLKVLEVTIFWTGQSETKPSSPEDRLICGTTSAAFMKSCFGSYYLQDIIPKT